MNFEELKKRIEFTQSYRDLIDASERLNRDIRAIIETDAKRVETTRLGEYEDFLGRRFGAKEEITTADFLQRLEKRNIIDILIYQLDTCPHCLGGLEIITETNKTTRRCKNCTFIIEVKVIEEYLSR